MRGQPIAGLARELEGLLHVSRRAGGTAPLFPATAVQILAGGQLTPLISPLPPFTYPALVATLVGWIRSLVRDDTSRP